MTESEKLTLDRVHSRIASTSNEDLAKVLEKLLPGLIPYSNNSELQPQVLTIISNITRRMKSLQTSIPCSQLLMKLVVPEMMPYACNIAISILDISIDFTPLSDRDLCAFAIIESLDKFENEYSYQTNSLLSYVLKFLPEISIVMKNNQVSHKIRRLISSWLLDISLIQPGLKKDGIGSIQAGLSKERVSRLTTKIDSYVSPMLGELKRKLLETIDINWVDPSCVVAISAICSCDSNPDVAREGVYKLNSLKSAIQESQFHFHPILVSLLHLCFIGYEEVASDSSSLTEISQLEVHWRGWSISNSFNIALSSNFPYHTHIAAAAIPGLEFRTPLREEILVQILHWIDQEAFYSSSLISFQKCDGSSPLDQIDGVSLSILQLMRRYFSVQGEFRLNLYPSPILLGGCLELITTWLQRYVALEDLKLGAPILKRTCVRALSRFLKTQNAVTSNFGQDDVDLVIKRKSYQIIDLLSRKIPQQMICDESGAEIISLLFRLLESENELVITVLFSALESLRLAFQDSNDEIGQTLKLLIQGARASSLARKRILALSWSKTLFGWTSITIESMLYLACDSTELVNSFAMNEIEKLKKFLRESSPHQFSRDSCEVIFSTLLKVKEVSHQLQIPSRSPQFLNLLKEILSVANIILETCTTLELRDFDGLVPFIGPPRWPVLKEVFMRQSSPLFDIQLLSRMATFMTAGDIEWETNFVTELSKLARNCCLLGGDQTTTIFLSNINQVFHWMEFEKNHPNYLSQTIGILALSSSDNSFDHVANIWRVLQHKLLHGSSDSTKVIGIACATAILVGLLPKRQDPEVLRWLSTHWEFIKNIAFNNLTSTNNILSLQALECIGTLGSSLTPHFQQHNQHNQHHHGSIQLIPIFSQLINHIGASYTETIEDLHRLIRSTNHDPLVLSTAIQTLSRMATVECDTALFDKTWSLLISTPSLRCHANRVVRYNLSESVVRLALAFDSFNSSHEKCNELLSITETITSTGAINNEIERGFAVLLLRVLLQQSDAKIFTADLLHRMTIVFLSVIRGGSKQENSSEKELFVQDVCCAGLCHIFQLSQSLELIQPYSNSLYASTSEKISTLVISTLCREKRSLPTAGIAVAGEATESIVVEDSRELEANLPIDLTGQPDQLLAAVANATAEFNIFTNLSNVNNNPQNTTTDNNNNNNNARRALSEDSYGIYTKVCKVAKRTGDSFVVFAVLSLIHRDPSYNSVGGELELFHSRYKAPPIQIDQERIRKFLPMLYLSKFDPNSSIREIMKTLWSLLIPVDQESSLLSAHCDEIIAELTMNLKSKNWKDRESACLALESFIPQRPWKRIRPSLQRLWDYGMDVLDDIRDSTRIAALGYMKTLANQIVSACNPDVNNSSINDREMVVDDITSFIIPILLDKGLLAPSPEGRGFSIGLLLRIVKISKSSLKDNLIRLVSVLVESMSAMEPRSLQYMEFHTERLNISNNELESTRLKLSQLSPLQDALDVCLESLQSPSCVGIIPDVISNLSLQTQQGIGLATRVTAVRSLLFLMNSCSSAWNSSSITRCFRSLIISIFPNPPSSESLRRDILLAIGTISKLCDTTFLGDQILKLISLYHDLNFTHPKLLADCLNQIILKSGELLQQERGMWKELLLCSYVGSFEDNQEVQISWTQLFADVIIQSGYGTKESSIKSILTRILQTISFLLASLSWSKRNQALAAFNDLITTFPSGILAPNTAAVVLSLLKVIPGQMWKGKENALKTFALLIEKCPQCIDDQDISTNFFSIYSLSNISNRHVLITLEDTHSRAGLIEQVNERLNLWTNPAVTTTATTTTTMTLSSSIAEEDCISTSEGQLVLPTNLGWCVSWKSLLRYFLNESTKGDRQYRLVVASSFLILPWNQLQSSTSALHCTLSLLEEISLSAGVSLERSKPSSEGNSNDSVMNSNRLERENQGKQRQIDIFGGRYGQDFQITKKSRKTKEIMSYEQENENMEEMKIEGAASSEGEEKEEKEGEGGGRGGEETEAELEEKEEFVQKHQTDPAYRLKYLECIAKLWPAQDLAQNEMFPSTENQKWHNFSEFLSYFIQWAVRVYKNEVWSIRKGILNVLSSFMKFSLSENELRLVLQILLETSNDSKYSQVRIASAEVMEQLLNETNLKNNLNLPLLTQPTLINSITQILANFSFDVTPAVIIHFTKANQEWFKIKKTKC